MAFTVVRLPYRVPLLPQRAYSTNGSDEVQLPVIGAIPTYPDEFYPSGAYPGSTQVTSGGRINYPAADNWPLAVNYPGEEPAPPVAPPTPPASSRPATATAFGSWGMAYYTRAAFTGVTAHSVELLGGVKAPESSVSYFWNSRSLFSTWAIGAWGGRQTVLPPSGGLTINPDTLAGTIAIEAWWADAPFLELARVTHDGTRTPVRGFSPFAVTGTTRHNLSVNPTCAVSTDGYVSMQGAISRLTGLQTPCDTVTTGLRCEQTSGLTGDLAVIMPERLAGQSTTRGWWMRCSVPPTTVQLWTEWADAEGNLIGTTTAFVSDAARAQSYRAWSWCVASSPAPASASYGTSVLVVTGISPGATVDVTGELLQLGNVLNGDFFDGSFTQGEWLNQPGLSASALAPIQYVIDGEAPLGVPVTYILGNPNSPGYLVTSQPVTLDPVNEGSSWVTHPGAPDYPVKLWVESAPDLTRQLDQGTFTVIGRKSPIVKSATVRRAPTGSLTFITDGLSERDRMLRLLSDGQPLLIRAPADYGYPGNWWVALGDVEEKLISNAAPSPIRKWVSKFAQVDAPVDYVSNSTFGPSLTRAALRGAPRLGDPDVGGYGSALVPPPQMGTRFASGLTSEGMVAAPTLFESSVPTVALNAAGFVGNALQIVLPSGGASNPGPGAGHEAGVQRTELVPNVTTTTNPDGVFGPGEVGFFGLAVQLPSGFPVGTAAFQVITQFHNATGAPGAPLEINVGNGQFTLTGNGGGWSIPICPAIAGQRYNIVLGVTFTESATTSVIDAWVNGIQYVVAQHPTGAGFLYAGVLNTWRYGIYRDTSITTGDSIEFGAVAYDSTALDAVQAYIKAA